ncbi:transglutaminaseTgpA domain-containing protein [Yinghuangia sp. YIM S10712]|uniref:transglutaminase family protein n=1 Tax=Yinghuangia sp. YIM S10712 TaxID=3436930 RepID=UPI003F53CEA3
MTGRLRMAVAAAIATSLTASSLLPLVKQGAWIAQALGAVAVVAVTGELVRRLSVPRPLIGPIQLVVLVPYLLLVLVPDVAGPIPTPDAIRAYGDLLDAGGNDVQNFAPPVPSTDGIGAILVTVVAGVAVMVDVIAVTYAQAAPAGLPLLALYSVPAALAESGLGWTVFLLSGLAYITLLLAEGRERLLRWGRPLAPPGANGPRPRPWGRGGGRIGLATLAVAVAIPAVIPMTANRLVDDDTSGGSDRITTINPVVNLQNELNRPENVDLLTYVTDADDPMGMYLRIAALDNFDGNSWQPSEQALTEVSRPLPTPQGLTSDIRREVVNTTVSVEKNYRQGSLPLPYAASRVSVPGNWRYSHEGRLVLGDDGQTVSGLDYTVESLDINPTDEQLRAANAVAPDMDGYRYVPQSLREAFQPIVDEKTAGAGSMFDKAVMLQNWFTSSEFTYDTKVPKGNGASALEDFMQHKTGYCEQFASAMAVMARMVGIPSRVAVGFVPGEPIGNNTYQVGSHDAHAWPELYFVGTGWVRFEPTPARGTSPGYTETVPMPVVTSQAPTAAPTESSAAPTPAQSQACAGEACVSPTPSEAAAAGGGGGDSWLSGVLIGVGVTALAALVLAGPMLVRQRVRRRRLAALSRDFAVDSGGRDPGDAVLGAWQEVLDTARDVGIRAQESETPRQLTARLLDTVNAAPAGDAQQDAHAAAAREALPRVALAAEQVMYAPEAPQRTIGLAEDVRVVRAALLASVSGGTRFRAAVLPASAFRRPETGPLEKLRSGREPTTAPGQG